MASEQHQISDEILTLLQQLRLSEETYLEVFVPMGIKTPAAIREAVQGEQQAERAAEDSYYQRQIDKAEGRDPQAARQARIISEQEEKKRQDDANQARIRREQEEKRRQEQEEAERRKREAIARQKAEGKAKTDALLNRKDGLGAHIPDEQAMGGRSTKWGRHETTMNIPNLTVNQTMTNLKKRYGVRLQAEKDEQARLQRTYNPYNYQHIVVPDAPIWKEIKQFLEDYEVKQADEYRRTHVASWREESGDNKGLRSIVLYVLDDYGDKQYDLYDRVRLEKKPLYEFCRYHPESGAYHPKSRIDAQGRRVLTIKGNNGRDINILLDYYYEHHIATTGELDSKGNPLKISEDLIVKFLAGTDDKRLVHIPLEVVNSAKYYDKDGFRDDLILWYLAATDRSQDILELKYRNWNNLSEVQRTTAIADSIKDRTQLYIDAMQDNWRSHNIGDGYGDDNGGEASHACSTGFTRGFCSKFYGAHPANVFVAQPDYTVMMADLAKEVLEAEFVKAPLSTQTLLEKFANDAKAELVLTREEEGIKEAFYEAVRVAIPAEVNRRYGDALMADTSREGIKVKQLVESKVRDAVAMVEYINLPIDKLGRARKISESDEITALYNQKKPPIGLAQFRQCVFNLIYQDMQNDSKTIEDGISNRIEQAKEHAAKIVTILGKTQSEHFIACFMKSDMEREDMLRNTRFEVQRVTDGNIYANNYIALLAGVISPAAITAIRTPLYYRYYGASAEERTQISGTMRQDIRNATTYATSKGSVDVTKTTEEYILEYLRVPLERDRTTMLNDIQAKVAKIAAANQYADSFIKALKEGIQSSLGQSFLGDAAVQSTIAELRTDLYSRYYNENSELVKNLLTLNLQRDVNNALEYAKLWSSLDGRRMFRIAEYVKAPDANRDKLLADVKSDLKRVTEANTYADSFMALAKGVDPNVKAEVRNTYYFKHYTATSDAVRRQLVVSIPQDVGLAKARNWQPPQ